MAQACQRDLNVVDASMTHSPSRMAAFMRDRGVDHSRAHKDRLSDPSGMYRSSVIEHPLYRDGIVRIQGDRSGAGGEGSRSKGGPKKTKKKKTKKKGR